MIFVIIWTALMMAVLASENNKLLNFQGRILNGQKAEPNQFPFQVLITYNREHPGSCGGSIITEEYVLTAAHCVKNMRNVKVFTGSIYFRKGTPQEVKKIVIHRDYVDSLHFNDIALIKIQKLTFSASVKAVRLSLNTAEKYEGEVGITAGWGVETHPGSSQPLMYTELTVISKEDCEKMMVDYSFISSEFCAYNSDGKTPRNGDSGGPFILKSSDPQNPLLIGVLYGRPKEGAAARHLAACTRVSSYVKWIEDVTDIHFNIE